MAVESEGFETAVEFPGGRVENPVEIPKDQLGKVAEARLGDARFGLDELGRRGWNLDKVGMFGHSFGGFTASHSTCPNADAGSRLRRPVDGNRSAHGRLNQPLDLTAHDPKDPGDPARTASRRLALPRTGEVTGKPDEKDHRSSHGGSRVTAQVLDHV
ncbi:hypothetical protein [Streptomyces sp. NPDC059757]|uniref:hypothetical protein n=1 Tax=Streptomyces sp. NPDC059757 TaxID=3346935 RepID=UPI0036512491